MKHTKTLFYVLLVPSLLAITPSNAQQVASNPKLPAKELAFNNQLSVIPAETPIKKVDKREKAREALPQLLRAVFSTSWNEQDVLLTVDAGWRNDSLSIEYKYYKGTNVLLLEENLLVEKIYFTVRPEEIDALDTETDEFLFLYIRNNRKLPNIQYIASRPGISETEVSWQSSLGFPVRPENLPMIIQYLKDLRSAD